MDEKKSILLINGHLQTGGAERSLTDVLRHMDYSRYDVDLLLLEGEGEYRKDIPDEVNVCLYPLTYAFGPFSQVMRKAIHRKDGFSIAFRMLYMAAIRYDLKIFSQAGRLFKGLKPYYDTVIAYRPGICTYLAAFTFKGGNRISWWHHGTMTLDSRSRIYLYQSYRRMSKIAAVSGPSFRLLADQFPDIQDKLIVIPNMVPIEEIRKKAKQYRPPVLKDVQLKIVTVCRMTAEKNLELCVKTAELLENWKEDFVWYLVGNGPEKEKIANMIRERGLEKRFVMPGALRNPYPYIGCADVMVHPSLIESQGLSVLEAMALRTPVIAVASEGPKEYIENNCNGFLVRSEAKTIAEKIMGFYKERDKYTVLLDHAEKTVEGYAPETVMERIYEII